MSVAAKDARGAGSVNVTAEPWLLTAAPASAEARVGLPACAETAKSYVAATSAGVMGCPFDHSRSSGSTTVYVRPSPLTA